MAHDDFSRALEAAKDKLVNLLNKRKELDEEIETHRKGVEYLARMADSAASEAEPKEDQPLASVTSFNDAISFALKSSRVGLTPTEVKDKLSYLGYELSKYKSDPLSSIHTVLKRFAKRGWVEVKRLPHNRTTYRWLSETERITKSLESSEEQAHSTTFENALDSIATKRAKRKK